MAVVDASVWVAYFHPQDKFHKRAAEIVKKLIEGGQPLRLPSLAFIEVAGALSRATKSPALAEKALSTLRRLQPEVWELDANRLEPKASALAGQLACRGADACYIAVAVLADDALWTFDKLQADLARKVARIGEP